MEAGLEKARPGNTCEDIAAAFFAALKRHGIEKDSRAGYPIGISYPPDWGERTMSIRMGDRSELKEKMTFHFMTASGWSAGASRSPRASASAPTARYARPACRASCS